MEKGLKGGGDGAGAEEREREEQEEKQKRLAALVQQLCDLSTEAQQDEHVQDPAAKLAHNIEDVLQAYQEQPQLLDPNLEPMVASLLRMIKTNACVNQRHEDAVFRILYFFTKVRGYKTIMKCFSHEATDLILVLERIEAEDPDNHQRWQHRYILLLWLALISLLPFDIAVFDEKKDGRTLPQRVLHICTTYLRSPDKSRDAAAQAAGRFFSRPDMVSEELEGFVDWCTQTLRTTADVDRDPVVVGIMTALPALLKSAQREAIRPFAERLLSIIQDHSLLSNANTLVRKLSTKLVQRVGLSHLPPRVASWRYNRGMRSLILNLQQSGGEQQQQQQQEGQASGHSTSAATTATRPIHAGSTAGDEEEGEDEFDVPEMIEEVLDVLLTGLGDRDTIVRWSSAKGVGRITGRLPKHLADEVVESLEGLFTYQEEDTSWHGGCLALAELARRGLLLPARLSQVVPVVVKALGFDVLRGACSVGTHVRDAACYVCWAFARAYAPEVLQPHVHLLASNLLVTAVFDRENNVRRAASAALQENVGRLGTIPHGIDIITTADYFAVGNRKHAYLDVAAAVCRHEEYRRPLVRHLAEVKLTHWDEEVRQLAAEAMVRLAPLAREHVADAFASVVLPNVLSIDLNTRQGAVYGIGAVMLGLGGAIEHPTTAPLEERSDQLSTRHAFFTSTFDHALIRRVQTFVSDLEEAKYTEGLGGALIRRAAVRTIERLALAGFSLAPPDNAFSSTAMLASKPLDDWVNFCFHGFEDVDDATRATSVAALQQLCRSYHASCEQGLAVLRERVLPRLLAKATQQNALRPQARAAAARALGDLPAHLLRETHDQVLEALTVAARASDEEPNAAVTLRQSALHSITTLLLRACNQDALEPLLSTPAVVHGSLRIFLSSLDDYTITSRGDVGSAVRLQAIEALGQVLPRLLARSEALQKDVTLVHAAVGKLLKQLAEKLDRLRNAAGAALVQVANACMQHLARDVSSSPSDAGGTQAEQEEGATVGEEERATAGAALAGEQRRSDIAAVCHDIKAAAASMDWAAAHRTFPVVVQMLRLRSFQRPLLHGLVVSVGGLTESLVHASSRALIQFVFGVSDAMKEELMGEMVALLRDHMTDDRIVIPLLKTCDTLIANACLDSLIDTNRAGFALALFELVKKQLSKCTNVPKIIQCIHVCCDLLSFEQCFKKAMSTLGMCLCNRYPRVRRVCCEWLYVALLGLDRSYVTQDAKQQVINILLNTQWDGDITVARQQRNAICDLVGIPKPKLKKAAARKPKQEKNELDSYQDLVDRAGY